MTSDRDGGGSGGLARTVFHCQRCLRHWAVFGRPPRHCREPEARVGGPSFAITRRNQEIFQVGHPRERETHREGRKSRKKKSTQSATASPMAPTSDHTCTKCGIETAAHALAYSATDTTRCRLHCL